VVEKNVKALPEVLLVHFEAGGKASMLDMEKAAANYGYSGVSW